GGGDDAAGADVPEDLARRARFFVDERLPGEGGELGGEALGVLGCASALDREGGRRRHHRRHARGEAPIAVGRAAGGALRAGARARRDYEEPSKARGSHGTRVTMHPSTSEKTYMTTAAFLEALSAALPAGSLSRDAGDLAEYGRDWTRVYD